MTAEIGTFLLVIAFLSALLPTAFLWPNERLRVLIAPCLPRAAWLIALCIAMSFFMLITLRLDDDFSVANAAMHSSRALPLLYKITGTWGNHEGSMLLWALVLAVFGLALAQNKDAPVIRHALGVQSALCAGVLLFILLTSNPFARIFPPPADGNALNPLLQDVALAIHPPLLYLGYVGFSIVFSLAAGAMLAPSMTGREFARLAHPWVLFSWSTLTLGIGLGSWWAYRELGWGGWWFWDPVENASLLPWLSGTALLHSNVALKKRGVLAPWVLLLAIVTFGLSLLGTFLVRSGVLTSVHGFASDPGRGLFILAYSTLAVGGALFLFTCRAGRFSGGGKMLPLSREGMIVFNNLFLLSACATVLLGTLYPLLADALAGVKVSVGPPYFNATFLPLMALPLLLAGLAPLMAWQRASARQTQRDAAPALLAALAAIFLALAIAKTHVALAAAGFGLAAWLATASFRAWKKAGLPVFLAHLGAACMVAGVTGAGLWQQETDRWLADGERIEIAGYTLAWHGEPEMRRENYLAHRGYFVVTQDERAIATLRPEYRIHDISGTGTSEAAIHAAFSGDLYAVIGETAEGRTSARVYHVPMIRFIWLGFMLMALGGLAALQKTRKRTS